jgi:hypothetical protein
MAVNVENITIERGTDFSKQFTILNSNGTAFNLTDYSVTAKLRKWGAASTAVSFAATHGSNPSLGKITISLSDSVTGILTAGRNVYDVLITSGLGTVTKIREGTAIIRDTASI